MPYCTVQTYTTSLVTYADIVKNGKLLNTEETTNLVETYRICALQSRDPLAFSQFHKIHACLNWRFCNHGHPYLIPNNYCPFHYF